MTDSIDSEPWLTDEGTLVVNVGYRGTDIQDASTIARQLSDLAVDVVRDYPFDACTFEVTPEGLEALRRHSDVRYVERDGVMTVPDPVDDFIDPVSPSTEEGGQCLPWGVDRVDAEVAHEAGFTGEGVDIAIIDTGIDPLVPSLYDNIGQGIAIAENDDEDAPFPWADDHYHGTHVAGTAAADDTPETDEDEVVGVAPDATLHAVKVLDGRGRGQYSDIAAGITRSVDRGWDVANLSLGGGKSAVVGDAIDYATKHDIVIVVSAGNAGPCEDCISYPGTEENVITVASTDEDDTLSRFSSTGPQMDVAAPGGEVTSCVSDGLKALSGTSMAAPHTTGHSAVLIGADIDHDEVGDEISESAEDIGLDENESGDGFIDVAASLGLDSSDDGTGNC